MRRVCSICGHDTRQTVGCAVDDCDFGAADRPHDHCGHEAEHGVCTTAGCMAATVDTGFKNPELG